MSVFLENDGKSKENDELCRTKIAGIAEKMEKNGKIKFHSKENDSRKSNNSCGTAPVHCMG